MSIMIDTSQMEKQIEEMQRIDAQITKAIDTTREAIEIATDTILQIFRSLYLEKTA